MQSFDYLKYYEHKSVSRNGTKNHFMNRLRTLPKLFFACQAIIYLSIIRVPLFLDDKLGL